MQGGKMAGTEPKIDKRTKTFTGDEMRRLLDAINEERDVLLCKKTDSATNRLKDVAWDRAVLSFNNGVEPGGKHRDADSLKSKWGNMKKKARQRCAALRANAVKTGGGRDYIPRDDILDRVIGMIGTLTADGIADDMGSDAALFAFSPTEEGTEGGQTSSGRPRAGPAEAAPFALSRRPGRPSDELRFDDILPLDESEETLPASGDAAPRRRPPSDSEEEDPYGGSYRRRRPAAAEAASSGPSAPPARRPSAAPAPAGESRSRSPLRRPGSSFAQRRQLWADPTPASLRTERSLPLRTRNVNRNLPISPLMQSMLDRNREIGEYYRVKKEYYAAKLALVTRRPDENQPPPGH